MKSVRSGTLVCALVVVAAAMVMGLSATGCSSDNPADRAGVGAQCTTTADCFETNQTCLTNFKGGYCGVTNCAVDTDCPVGAACVAHSDGVKYCFRLCGDKPECNLHRSVENESNCVGNVTFTDSTRTTGKACVPPSSGI